jgi:hypothetical protein
MCGDPMCWSCGPAQGYDPKMEALYERICKSHDWVDLDTMAEVIDFAFDMGYQGEPINHDNLFRTFPVLMPYRLSQVQPMIAEAMRFGIAEAKADRAEEEMYEKID